MLANTFYVIYYKNKKYAIVEFPFKTLDEKGFRINLGYVFVCGINKRLSDEEKQRVRHCILTGRKLRKAKASNKIMERTKGGSHGENK